MTKRPYLTAFLLQNVGEGTDSLTASHLSLREKMSLVNLDLALVQSGLADGTRRAVDSEFKHDGSLTITYTALQW